jgi:hypothetical protein
VFFNPLFIMYERRRGVQFFASEMLGSFATFFRNPALGQANQAIAGDWRMLAEINFCGSGATAGIQLQKAQSLKRRRRDSAINETLVRMA